MKKYYAINSKWLAYSLCFVGFKFYKFNDKEYGEVYSFENTIDLQNAIKDINKLRRIYKE